MTKKEKLERVTEKFSLLPAEKQDHILGVLQALAFAHDQNSQDGQLESVSFDLEQKTE